VAYTDGMSSRPPPALLSPPSKRCATACLDADGTSPGRHNRLSKAAGKRMHLHADDQLVDELTGTGPDDVYTEMAASRTCLI